MSSEAVLYGRIVKISHLFSGIFLWELITTLDFEWEVFSGRRPWKWSFAAYMMSRILCLTAVILILVVYNVTSEINCNFWLRSVLVASWFSVAIASFLLALRGIAIWGRNKIIIMAALILWFANMAASLYSSTLSHVTWNQQAATCVTTGTDAFRWSILTNLISDMSLLCIMFLGVLRKKNATSLWRMLYFQGIFWIMTAAATELPSLILPFLNINDTWNLMFEMPHMVLMVTMSTRLYRNLFQYITNDHYPFNYRHPNFLPQQKVQVAVHRTVEVDVELRHMDEEQLRSLKQTVTMRSQAELDIIAAELQMKSDLQI